MSDKLRDAVGRLMAARHFEAWWALYDWDADIVTCAFCDAPWSDTADAVTHDPDCPAMAVEEAYRAELA